MNRVIRGTLVLTILVGTMVTTAPADDPAVPDEWKSLDVAGLTNLAKQFVAKGDAGVDDCKLLASYVAQRYADASSAGQVDWNDWLVLAEALWDYFPEATRTAMAQDMQQKLTPNDGAIAGLTLEQAVMLIKVLGDETSRSFCATWICASDKYKSASPTDTYFLTRVLESTGEVGKPARQRMVGHVKAVYLKDKAATRSVKPYYWRRYALCLRGDLSIAERISLAAPLCEAFSDSPELLGTMNAKEFWHLAYAVFLLDATKTSRLVLSWFNANKEKGFDSVSSRDLARIAHSGAVIRTEMGPMMNQFETIWLARHSQEPLKRTTLYYIIRAWLGMGDQAKAQQWVMRMYEITLGTEQARASANAASIRLLGQLLRDTGLTGKGKGHPEFAAVAARLAREGKLPADKCWRYKYYAAPLGTPETRQTLQAELIDAEGNPRPIVASVMAWAYDFAGQLKTWQAFLDEKIATPGMGADTKARWMLAKAFAESILPDGGRSPLRSKKWLDQALATATSASLRLEVVQEFVAIYRGRKRPAVANSLLESVKNQFSGDELAKIEATQRELQDEQARIEATEKARKAAAEIARKKGRLAYYHRRLVVHQARGDTEEVARLQAAIKKLEQELQP